jgi:hypothetical protein
MTVVVGIEQRLFANVDAATLVSPSTAPPDYKWQEKWYPNMPIDHFSFADTRTFALRYLVNDTYWRPGGPVFFYCGNEGAIELFTLNTVYLLSRAAYACCGVWGMSGGEVMQISRLGSHVGLGAALQRYAHFRRTSILRQNTAVRQCYIQNA